MVRLFSMILGLLATIWVCSVSVSAAEKVPLFVSIEPQRYIVQQIGKDLVDVQVMVQPGASPHTYEPRPAQMAALSRTRLYFSVGVEFEQVWLPRFTAINPHMTVAPMDQGIEKIPMAEHRHDDDLHHAHAPAHTHAHADNHSRTQSQGHAHAQDDMRDPHIWLSPPLVKSMALNALDALVALAPEHAAAFRENHGAFDRRLDWLHERIGQMLADRKGDRFLVFHPSWGYFAHAYGLEQIPIEVDGKEPKPAQLQYLIRQAREMGIKVLFAQPQFSTRSARMVAEAIGGEVILADPLAYDWEANLLEQVAALQRALR